MTEMYEFDSQVDRVSDFYSMYDMKLNKVKLTRQGPELLTRC